MNRSGAINRNHIVVTLHIVWATKNRQPLILPKWEDRLYACLVQTADDLRCPVLAVNGVADHVHLVILLHPTVSISHLLKHLKGSSSHLVNHEILSSATFRWHDGYSATAVSRRDQLRAVEYVQNQKHHHGENPEGS